MTDLCSDPILSGEDTDNDVYDRKLYYKLICENLEADIMLKQYPYDIENISCIKFDIKYKG